MALVKEYTDTRGNVYTESYWRLTQVTLRISEGVMAMMFLGYKDRDARKKGYEEIGKKYFTLEGKDFNEIYTKLLENTDNITASSYECAKEDDFFSNAKDV